ncbi:MAG: hypothetical protein WCT39_05920, partial [Candidatus Margulisiibacteriota bacterium]
SKVERAYIPTLLYTETFNQRSAHFAVERLKDEWGQFYSKYYSLELKYGVDITDKFWKSDLDAINSAIASTEVFINANMLPAAFTRLYTVRGTLRDIRHRHNIESVLDRLTDFDDALQKLYGFGRSRRKISDRDATIMGKMFDDVQAKWELVERSKINASLYKFNFSKSRALKKRLKDEGARVDNLAALVPTRDLGRILSSILDLRKEFTLLYKAFGDFEPIINKLKEQTKQIQRSKPSTTTTTLAGHRRKKASR